jgi:hypothetical protein
MARTDVHRPFRVDYPDGWGIDVGVPRFPRKRFARPRVLRAYRRVERRQSRHRARQHIVVGRWDMLGTREPRTDYVWYHLW